MAENDDAMTAWDVFAIHEGTTVQRTNAEDVEEACGDQR